MSMLRTMLHEAGGRRIAVLLGARHSWDLGYQSELLTMDRLSPALSYQPIISRPKEEPVPWGGLTGPSDTRVFLCGNPAMIEDMVAILADEGFREHSRKEPGHVFVEKYW